MLAKILSAILLFGSPVFLPACEEGVFEEAGEEVDEVVEDTKDAFEEGAEDVDRELDEDRR